MESSRNDRTNVWQRLDFRRLMILLMLFCLIGISVKQSAAVSSFSAVNRYYVRASECDDGGKVYLNNDLIVNVGFDEDSNWLDITEDVLQGKDQIKFEVINKTGAITYNFQVKRNDTIIFEQSCGKVKEVGCENNRAFKVGKARKFIYTIEKDK
jgi:hypothetical protein